MFEQEFRDYKKRKLSQSDSGRGIKVAATASPGTLIHTATASVAANEWDAVWLKAVNTSGSAVVLTVQWGATTSPDDEIKVTLQPQAGLIDIITGLVLDNQATIRAYAATANAIVVHGFVNHYEQTPTR